MTILNCSERKRTRDGNLYGSMYRKTLQGENVEFVNPLGNGENAKEQANAIRAKLSIYMNFVRENIDDISDKNKPNCLDCSEV